MNKCLFSSFLSVFFFLSIGFCSASTLLPSSGKESHTASDENTAASVPLRRIISPTSPAWVIHIDTWIYPDPQKCIELIPEDIRPYVIFNISLSISDFVIKKYPFSIAESWLRTCAENRVWATIQPASGYTCNFSYTDLDVYEYFYQYPNFLGWNFAEQNWGFSGEADLMERLDLFTELLKMAERYGGYVFVSNFLPVGNFTNALGKLKTSPAFAEACKTYQEHYVVLDKYTSESGFYDNESANLGTYLSGHSGHYGVRFDECGYESRETDFPEATGLINIMEHFMLTGATVTDGPELTWRQTLKQDGTYTDNEGYTVKKFGSFTQFDNISIDLFRKILDGSAPIPDREEVIERTRIAYVNDVYSGSNTDIYNASASLYTGLYAVDGELSENKTWLKKSGRYPSIPMIYKEAEFETGGFEKVVLKSEEATRWPAISDKVNEFNALFPQKYTGDLFVGNLRNNWLIYHPYMDDNISCTANLPFIYNTCDSMAFSFERFGMGLVNEDSCGLNIYLNNYCSSSAYGMRTDVINVYGSTVQPSYTWTDRSSHTASLVSSQWSNNVFSLTVKHNGAIDIVIQCKGNADRQGLNIPEPPVMQIPAEAPVYTGPRQYEAESFDYKDITSINEKSYQNYTAMAYINFGKKSTAAIKKTIHAFRAGRYTIDIKYHAPVSKISSVSLYVNGIEQALSFPISSAWQIISPVVSLNSGDNVIEIKAKASSVGNLYLDNIIVRENNANGTLYHFENDAASEQAGTPAAEWIDVLSGSAGVSAYPDNTSAGQCFKAYSTGSIHQTGVADLKLFPATAGHYTVSWKEYAAYGAKNGMLLCGNNTSSYAEGLKQGYLFIVENKSDSGPSLISGIVQADSFIQMASFTPSFSLSEHQACWYRAAVVHGQILFECSNDSLQWQGAVFQDDSYTHGATQVVWGLGSDRFNWGIDYIAYDAAYLDLSKTAISDFKYEYGNGPSNVQSFGLAGKSLLDDIRLEASENFELSLSADSAFASTMTLQPIQNQLTETRVYVRLKADLNIRSSYSGSINISSARLSSRRISLTGEVCQPSVMLMYDFSADKATTYAQTPPATKLSIGKNNGATAGVVSYTDANKETSNMLKAYSSGNRNGTGIITMSLFSKEATDYSITWKQCIDAPDKEYKIGVLLRGDYTQVGNESRGYTQGMMNGYVYIVYHTGSASQFRIYKATDTYGSLDMLINQSANFLPEKGIPVWYRASVSGTTPVRMSFEYSLDSLQWTIGASTADNAGLYTSGASQIVWGLAAARTDFYMDNITFYGIPEVYDHSVPVIESKAWIVSQEYYNLIGQKILSPELYEKPGPILVKNIYSDGTTQVQKIILHK